MKTEAKRSEERGAAWFGDLVPFSGAKSNDKLDIVGTGIYLGKKIENKFTEKKSYSIKLASLLKQEKQGLITGHLTIRRVEFKNEKGALHPYILEPECMYRATHEYIKELEDKIKQLTTISGEDSDDEET